MIIAAGTTTAKRLLHSRLSADKANRREYETDSSNDTGPDPPTRKRKKKKDPPPAAVSAPGHAAAHLQANVVTPVDKKAAPLPSKNNDDESDDDGEEVQMEDNFKDMTVDEILARMNCVKTWTWHRKKPSRESMTQSLTSLVFRRNWLNSTTILQACFPDCELHHDGDYNR
jgi:hypothetical protein